MRILSSRNILHGTVLFGVPLAALLALGATAQEAPGEPARGCFTACPALISQPVMPRSVNPPGVTQSWALCAITNNHWVVPKVMARVAPYMLSR